MPHTGATAPQSSPKFSARFQAQLTALMLIYKTLKGLLDVLQDTVMVNDSHQLKILT